MKIQFSSVIRRWKIQSFVLGFLGMGIVINAQEHERVLGTSGAVSGSFGIYGGIGSGIMVSGSVNDSNHVATCAVFFISGNDVGAVLVNTCDLNHDGVVTLNELEQVASACFKLWDTDNGGSLSQTELLDGIKGLFPQPPILAGLTPPPDELTPPGQLAKHIVARAGSSKDGSITVQELITYLDNSFGQWDQDSNGALTAQELAIAFAQLSVPDEPGTPAPFAPGS